MNGKEVKRTKECDDSQNMSSKGQTVEDNRNAKGKLGMTLNNQTS